MSLRPVVIGIGVGITALLLVGAIVTSIVARMVEFSVFVGLPAGILAGILVAVWAYSILSGRPSVGARRGLAAVATFGYVVVVLFLIRYAVAATREILTLYVVIGIGAVAAIALLAYLSFSTSRRSPMQG